MGSVPLASTGERDWGSGVVPEKPRDGLLAICVLTKICLAQSICAATCATSTADWPNCTRSIPWKNQPSAQQLRAMPTNERGTQHHTCAISLSTSGIEPARAADISAMPFAQFGSAPDTVEKQIIPQRQNRRLCHCIAQELQKSKMRGVSRANRRWCDCFCCYIVPQCYISAPNRIRAVTSFQEPVDHMHVPFLARNAQCGHPL